MPMPNELMWIASPFPPHNTPPKFDMEYWPFKVNSRFEKKTQPLPSIHVNSFGWIYDTLVYISLPFPMNLSSHSLIEAGACAHAEGCVPACPLPKDGNCWALEMFPVNGLAATGDAWPTAGAVVTLDSITATAVGSKSFLSTLVSDYWRKRCGCDSKELFD